VSSAYWRFHKLSVWQLLNSTVCNCIGKIALFRNKLDLMQIVIRAATCQNFLLEHSAWSESRESGVNFWYSFTCCEIEYYLFSFILPVFLELYQIRLSGCGITFGDCCKRVFLQAICPSAVGRLPKQAYTMDMTWECWLVYQLMCLQCIMSCNQNVKKITECHKNSLLREVTHSCWHVAVNAS